MQVLQKARIRYIVKNGNQQNMKPPTMMPNVLAAFVSIRNRFTCALMFRFPIRFEIIFGLFVPSSQLLGLGLVALSPALSQLLDLREDLRWEPILCTLK